MITVREAKQKILDNIVLFDPETVPLSHALKRVIADNITSPIPNPLFNQSAVDGFALRHGDLVNSKEGKRNLKIIGEIKAGDTPEFTLSKNETVRIFTGALIPEGCDTVIMQEDVERDDSNIFLKVKPRKGANIRNKGGQIEKGQIALHKGTALNSASIGFLASLGMNAVKVSRLPKVSIIVTGNEFVRTHEELKTGKIFESNGLMLQSVLGDININSDYVLCEDNIDILTKVVNEATNKKDITIITGGVSVGDYDFTRAVLEKLDFRIIFHKVSQKPGMPILLAGKGDKTVFGLPGNPRSVLVCFYEYIYPFIQASMGNTQPFLVNVSLPLIHGFEKNNERAFFLTAKLVNNAIQILEGQDSHMLKSFADADALVFLHEGKRIYTEGDKVEVHLLPG